MSQRNTTFLIAGSFYPSPVMAILGSIFIPGLGHVFIGQTEKGIIYLIQSFIYFTLASFFSYFFIGLLVYPFYLIFWITMLHDCWTLVKKLSNGKKIGKLECSSKISLFLLFRIYKGFISQSHEVITPEDIINEDN